jgi:hypothetical protein
MSDADRDRWRSLRELDAAAGLPKGSAFRMFKHFAPQWQEDRDFMLLDRGHEARALDALLEPQRLYRSSLRVILLSREAADAVLNALREH